MTTDAQKVAASDASPRGARHSRWRRRVVRLIRVACVAVALLAIVLYAVSGLYAGSVYLDAPRRLIIGVQNGSVRVSWTDQLLIRWDPAKTRVSFNEVPRGELERQEYPATWRSNFYRKDEFEVPYPFLISLLARDGPRSEVMSSGIASFLDNQRDFAISLLTIAFVAGFPPLVATLRRLAARVRSQTICGGCGFDMRATPGRCPECGLAAADQPPRSAVGGRFGPPLVALALILIVALVHAATARYLRCGVLFAVGWSYDDHTRTPRAPESGWSSNIWVDNGALLFAYTTERDRFADSYPSQVAAQAPPSLTGLGWLEPAFLTVPTPSFGNCRLLRIPLWIVLLALGGGVWLWIASVRRRGGFYLGRLNAASPAQAAPAAR